MLNDEMVKVNMNFNHDVNYLGLFNLEEALMEGKPSGLKTLGYWSTIYEGLSELPSQIQKSWFDFDHYYSDCSFREALDIVFRNPVKKLMDIGGNTGRWAAQCVSHNPDVHVTIVDLPQQLGLMTENISTLEHKDRIHGVPCNMLEKNPQLPDDFDVIWMSQFLDCFSEDEIKNILRAVVKVMDKNSTLYIMETFWDRQKFETAAYCLTQISVYFTALANGNSKMYFSKDLIRCIEDSGLMVKNIYDELGMGHSIVECKLKEN